MSPESFNPRGSDAIKRGTESTDISAYERSRQEIRTAEAERLKNERLSKLDRVDPANIYWG